MQNSNVKELLALKCQPFENDHTGQYFVLDDCLRSSKTNDVIPSPISAQNIHGLAIDIEDDGIDPLGDQSGESHIKIV